MINSIKLTFLIIFCCYSCSQSNQKTEAAEVIAKALDESTLCKYIKTVSQLENEQPGLLNRFNNSSELNKSDKETFEKLINKNGFEKVHEFKTANLKITIIYNSIYLMKDKDESKNKKMSENNLSKAEFELVQKYLQELAEVLQDIKIPNEIKK